MVTAAAPGGLKPPIEATVEVLAKHLEEKPILWVGAGASVAAGCPSTQKILDEMRRQADDPLPDGEGVEFYEVVDAFVDSMSGGALLELLQKLFGQPRPPTPFHQAVARLAGQGHLAAILTTNFDSLIEDALRQAGVRHVLQVLDRNEVAGANDLRVIKVHGSLDSWHDAVLSGRSYDGFHKRYKFLDEQLDILLRQRRVLFAGCSMTDPRILDWLAGLSAEKVQWLKPWRSLMTADAWARATTATWYGKPAAAALSRGNIRPFTLRDHAHLPELFTALADKLGAPPAPTVTVPLVVPPTAPAPTPPDPAILALLDRMNALLPAQFDELVFRLGVAKHRMPPDLAPLGQRAEALLQLQRAQGAAGIEALTKALDVVSR